MLLDHHASSTFLWRDDVQKFIEAAEMIRKQVAMTPEESTGAIADIVNGLETT